MSGGVKLKMDVELEAFLANVDAYQAMTKKTASDTVRDIAKMIIQAGAQKKKRSEVLPIAPLNRTIIKAVRRYRHGVEELAMNARPEAPGDRAMFLIPRPERRRPIAKSGDRRFWVFDTLQKAKDHQKITNRGVGRAGFWAQLPALGYRFPAGVNLALADIPGIAVTDVHLNDPLPSITVTNSSVAIQRLAEFKTPLILSKVTNRVAGMANANKKKYFERFKAAGGVMWRQAGTFDGESFGEYISAEDL